jgi:SAM-dependent methyltransferase
MTDPAAGDIEAARAQIVDRYSALARQVMAGRAPADSGTAGDQDGDCFGGARYAPDEALPESALRAGLGCGNPLAVAGIGPGETVLDLGSGGGLDVILSARRAGPGGKAYGLDASTDMLALARANAEKAGIGNAEFLHGHIEDIPLPDGHIDVVISNCVINLSADKARVLAEAYRVLRPGGRFGVTDVIADDGLEVSERVAAERQVGCASGTLTAAVYRDRLLAAGFTAVAVTPTHQVAPGLTSAIIQATKPAGPDGVGFGPARAHVAP